MVAVWTTPQFLVSFLNGRLTMVINAYEAGARCICWLTFPLIHFSPSLHLYILYSPRWHHLVQSCPRWLGSARWSSPRSFRRACVPAGGRRRQRRPSGRCVTRRGSVFPGEIPVGSENGANRSANCSANRVYRVYLQMAIWIAEILTNQWI